MPVEAIIRAENEITIEGDVTAVVDVEVGMGVVPKPVIDQQDILGMAADIKPFTKIIVNIGVAHHAIFNVSGKETTAAANEVLFRSRPNVIPHPGVFNNHPFCITLIGRDHNARVPMAVAVDAFEQNVLGVGHHQSAAG